MARHIIGCYLTHETRVRNALDDVGSDICQALTLGAGRRGAGEREGGYDLADIARRIIDTHLKPLFLELNGIL